MTPFDQALKDIFKIDPWGVAKFFVLLFLGIYVAFSVVIIRQVKLMIGVLDGNFNLPLKSIAWFIFLLSVMVFFLGLVVL